jgi:hypothetical protein
MGGIFQLIAYGAQDLYLTSNFKVPKLIWEPKTLQKYAFKSLSEKDKTYVFNNYKEVFPKLIEKLDSTRRYNYANVVGKFAANWFNEANDAIRKMKNYKTISENEAKNIQRRVKGYFTHKKLQLRNLKREDQHKDEPLDLSELFCD